MERKIGEIFEFEGKKLQVKAAGKDSCEGCILDGKCTRGKKSITGFCERGYRDDEKRVIFVEVHEQPQKTEEIKERRVGEVFEYEGKRLIVNEEKNGCDGCFFDGQCNKCRKDIAGNCGKYNRNDHNNVIFVDIDKEETQDEQPLELNLSEVLKYCPRGETFWSPMFGDVMYYGIIKGEVCVTVASGERIIINADGTLTISFATSPEIMLYPSREQRDWAKVRYEPKKKKFDPKTLQPFDRVLARDEYSEIWSCDLFSHIDNGESYKYFAISTCWNYCIPYNDDTKHLVGTKDEAPEFYRYWED